MPLVIHNLDIFIRKIKNVGGGAPAYMGTVLERAMREDIWPEWIAHISLSDHTLEELRELGHPYSQRYAADSFVHPDAFVHEQTNDLIAGSNIVTSDSPSGRKITLINTSPHYIFLRYGTKSMRMRDPGGATLSAALPKIKARFAQEVKAAIVQYFTA